MSPKEERLLNYFRQGNSITSLEAFNILGDSRLSATIFELKKLGVPIQDKCINVPNRFGESCRVKEYWVEDFDFTIHPKSKKDTNAKQTVTKEIKHESTTTTKKVSVAKKNCNTLF